MSDRTDIYYWKCDRAAAFHGTEAIRPENPLLEAQLLHALEQRFPGAPLALRPADGQGNHRTFRLTIGETFNTQHSTLDAQDKTILSAFDVQRSAFAVATPLEAFVRTEDGPERDNYFAVETRVIAELRRVGIPAPEVLACDCDRTATSFAWQVLSYIPYPDLNRHDKQGALVWPVVAEAIGEAVARWQAIRPAGYGPFSAEQARASNRLIGLHASYASYYTLNLDRHLQFLSDRGFFSAELAETVRETVRRHAPVLDIGPGCLVHKDLALWNMLGTPQKIVAFIDWDDAVSGDPMDDLSLLACFYDAPVVASALAGYAHVRPLPENHLLRFWLHLLRNMLVKAVIRVGAGYFARNDSFFLIGAGRSGADLETFTRARIDAALRGLNDACDLSILHS